MPMMKIGALQTIQVMMENNVNTMKHTHTLCKKIIFARLALSPNVFFHQSNTKKLRQRKKPESESLC